ncbi:Predicted dehydrogenase [Rhizobiales bacterium GAS188]|nr:Predicted dehydrogenase [Rhizobiales bacterium GAS188]
MKTLAIVGCGHWGSNHVRLFNSLPKSRVKTLVDNDGARLARLRDQFMGTQCVQDIAEVLRDPEIDAVVIASPTGTHHRLVRDSLSAGKHVLCEKPLAKTSDEADELVEMAGRAGRVLMVGHVFLFNGGIIKLKELCQTEEIGKLQYFAASRTNLGPIRSDVNAAYDLATHDISIFNWLLESEPETVSATGHAYLQPRVEDVVFIAMQYPQGVVANIRASWLDPKKVRQISTVGSKGMATWDDLDLTTPVAIYDKGAMAEPDYKDYAEFLRISMWDGDVRLPRVKLAEPLSIQNQHFLEALDGKPYRSDGHFAAGVVRSLEAAAKSMARGGAPVTVQKK